MNTQVVVDSQSMIVYSSAAFIDFLSRKHNVSLGTLTQENINAFNSSYVLVELPPKPISPPEITTYTIGKPVVVDNEIKVDWEASRSTYATINKFYNQIFEEIIEDEVKELGYKDVANAFTYTTSSNPRILAEVRNFFEWRDLIWSEFEELVNPHIEDLITDITVVPLTKLDIVSKLSKLPKIVL